MKKEYIERFALLAALDGLNYPWCDLDDAYEIAQKMPAADVAEIKYGKWKDDPYVWYCDQCDKWLEVTQGTADMNFCPHCGAMM